ncbi:MAG: FkbM family methyltransferase [Candidatus Parvarchaeota archaeon]
MKAEDDNYSKLQTLILIRKHTDLTYYSILKGYRNPDKRFTIKLKTGEKIKNVRLRDVANISVLLEHGWSVSEESENLLTVGNDRGISIICRLMKGYDLGHLIEIFINKVYGTDFAGKNVIDVGASNGDSSISFAIMGAKKVVGIEPFPESFGLAQRNIFQSRLESKIVALNKAISGCRGKPISSSTPITQMQILLTLKTWSNWMTKRKR